MSFVYLSLTSSQWMVRLEQEQEWRGGCPEAEAQGGACNTFRNQVSIFWEKWSAPLLYLINIGKMKLANILPSSYLIIPDLCLLDTDSQTLAATANQSVCPPATHWLEWQMTLDESHCWTWPGVLPYACGKVRRERTSTNTIFTILWSAVVLCLQNDHQQRFSVTWSIYVTMAHYVKIWILNNCVQSVTCLQQFIYIEPLHDTH